MEVAIDNNNKTPFQKEIREWQHIDPNTGALLTGRFEADRWVNGPLNTYGKMISHNLSTPDGTQHTHRKQMEILQARTSAGSLQVVRAQTVQTSSSRWSAAATSTTVSSSNILDYDSHNGNHHNMNGDGSNYHLKQNLLAITQKPSYSNGQSSPINLSNFLHSASHNSNGPHTNSHNSHYSQSQTHSHYNGFGQANGVHHQPEQLQQASSAVVDCLLQSKNFRSSLLLPTDGNSQQQKLNKFDNVGGNVFKNNMTKHMDFNQNFNSERENHIITESSSFIRGKSISTEDLTAERNELNFDDDVEPSEWKRVSKIRRSLQFPRSSIQKSINTRPPDLPENSVSVRKIKQEIENGRRLSTAMRNNHVDFIALDNILKGVAEPELKVESRHSKKATIITAESLKEIRGKLRRLSDESLYKDDMSPSEDNNHTEFEVLSPTILEDSQIRQQTETIMASKYSNDSVFTAATTQRALASSSYYNSNSLESKNRKDKEVSPDDWCARERRKSYGFEKMKAPAETLEKMESSTDSGLGRSSDLNSLWSPTESTPRKGTIVTLGEFKPKSSSTSIALFNGSHEIRQHNFNLTKTYEKPAENKRHSIAVDETHYVRENLRKVFDGKSLIHLNGAYNNEEISTSQEGFIDENGRKHKRVEFCKTEIHFAAESGRVNIVETDGKPPPTNNYRRRRRSSSSTTSSSYLEPTSFGKPIILFSSAENSIMDSDKSKVAAEVHEGRKITATVYNSSATTTTSTSSAITNEDIDMQTDDISLRGILKNKPLKPKPYHLGENLENNDGLWGVRLRPVSNEFTSWKAPTDIEDEEMRDEPQKPSNQRFIKEKEDMFTSFSNNSNSLAGGFSTKIKLTAEPWQQKESFTPKITTTTNNSNHEMSTTTISIGINNGIDHNFNTTINNHKIMDIKLNSPIEPSDELRSTSLIIRTLKSATQFDEAMKQLNNTSITDHIQLRNGSGSAFQLVSTSLPKSNSASCLLQRSYPKLLSVEKYSSSLDGDCFLNSDTEDYDYDSYNERQRAPNAAMTSSQYEDKTRDEVNLSRLANFKSFISQNYSEKGADMKKPIAAPRLKKLESNVLSHQLSQLRRMYDAAEESDDSAKADEEVNLYLGSLVSEKTAEVVSGSWSRIKAKKTSQQAYKTSETTTTETDKIHSMHSNKMSIELHSPVTTRRVKPTSLLLAPVAQPRNILPAITNIQPIVSSPKHFRTDFNNDIQPTKEELRILKLSPGTRQLRDHELTFFGVRKSMPLAMRPLCSPTASSTKLTTNKFSNNYSSNLLTQSTKTSKLLNSPTNTHRNDIKLKNCHINYSNDNADANSKWQLSNDKPDLLKHSTSADLKTGALYTKSTTNQLWRAKQETKTRAVTPTKLVMTDDNTTAAADMHIYENMKVAKPQKIRKYDRKLDLQRDEAILDELSRAADEIMNTVKEFTEAEEKKKRSKDASRTPQRQLDTISEKKQLQSLMTTRVAQLPKDIDDIARRTHRLCRISSASSNESISKNSSTNSKQSLTNSRRASVTAATTASINHRHESNSNSSGKSASRKKITTASDSKRMMRTSSREKLLSQASSSEDLPNHKVDAPRRPRRLKTTKDREREKDKDYRTEPKSDIKKTEYKSSTSSLSRHRLDKPIGPHKVHKTTEANITSKTSRISTTTDPAQSTKSRSKSDRTTSKRSSSTAATPMQSSTTTTSRRIHR